MKHRLCSMLGALALIGMIAVIGVQPASADVMDFTGIASTNFTWTEGNLTLAGNGSTHFHNTSVGGNTAAVVYGGDGDPLKFTWAGSNPFTLNSIDFVGGVNWNFDVLFTASNGSTQTVTQGTSGTVAFGAGFAGVTNVMMTSPTSVSDANAFFIDNVTASEGRTAVVPEGDSIALMAAGLVPITLLASRRRRGMNRKAA
jgi:hypothetical protein